MRDNTSSTNPSAGDSGKQEPRTYRSGCGWVERSDGYIWIDPGSGAGHWRRGYYDNQADRPVLRDLW